MDRARVAVEGEDDLGSSAVKSSTNALVGHAVRVDVAREQRHQVDDVDDPHRAARARGARSSQAAASVSSVGTSPAQAEHDVRLAAPSSVPAQSQTDAPRAQCVRAASSRSRHCSCGCLSITIRLT